MHSPKVGCIFAQNQGRPKNGADRANYGCAVPGTQLYRVMDA